MSRDEAELIRIAAELGEPIEIVRDLHQAMVAVGEEGDLEAQTDRWERARDAAYDAPGAAESQMPNLDAAIETAIRVRIDDIVLAAFANELTAAGILTNITNGAAKAAMRSAFRAAGFVVES